MEDLEYGLQLCPKVTTEHINLTPYSVMNVQLAAQVLSTSVSTALKTFGPPEVLGTAKYCEMFDSLNVRNSTESVTKLRPFLASYSSVNGERFTWLLETFLPYFTKWKTSFENNLVDHTHRLKNQKCSCLGKRTNRLASPPSPR